MSMLKMSSVDLFAPSSETRRMAVELTLEKCLKIGMNEGQAKDFLALREKFLCKPIIKWEEVLPAPDDFFYQYSSLPDIDKKTAKEFLEKLVVVELNGGLGASMGCKGPKSSLRILKNELTFLDCKVRQIEELNREFNVDVPLVLMNSFMTHEETLAVIEKYKNTKVSIYNFVQSKYPLLYRDTVDVVPLNDHDKKSYYPPGSGEVFKSFYTSGLLEKFHKLGKEYMFISNIENLGASVDPKILQMFAKSDLEFLLEVTNRISSDTKGGFPIQYSDKRVHVLELSQIPYSETNRFPSGIYKWWNTNNSWARIGPVINYVKANSLELDFVVRPKTLHGGKAALQLEQPASMSIQSFKKSAAMCVPRKRNKNVKSTSDLLQAQSDMFLLEKGVLIMNPKRAPDSYPVIKFGEEFQNLDDYEKRFKSIPNILELDHLTVSGDVTFGSNVTLKGTVIIVADQGSHIDIPDNTVLENKVVSGWLHMNDY